MSSTRNAMASSALALAVLVCVSGCSGKTAAAPAAGTASASGTGSPQPATSPRPVSARRGLWPVRTVLPESIQETLADQIVDPRADAVYALVSKTTPPLQGPYLLRRTDLATGSVRQGPVFRASDLTLAAGYLWIFGPPPSGQRPPSQLVLAQVDPQTLAVIRTLRLPGANPAGLVPQTDVVTGPGGSIWAGAFQSLLRISPATGAVLDRAGMPADLVITGLAVDPAGRYLYVSAAHVVSGGGMSGAEVFEYDARSGQLLASTASPPISYSVAGAALTAAPGGVWASIRTGMLGLTALLRSRGLVAARLPGAGSSPAPPAGGIFHYAMGADTIYGGGALWLAAESGVVACIGPRTGRVRARTQIPQLVASNVLLAVDPSSHVIFGLGRAGVVEITPPPSCWG